MARMKISDWKVDGRRRARMSATGDPIAQVPCPVEPERRGCRRVASGVAERWRSASCSDVHDGTAFPSLPPGAPTRQAVIKSHSAL